MIVGAGAGSFLVKAIANDLGCRFMHAWEAASMRSAGQSDLDMQYDIGVCFPAYAVAYLRINSVFSHKT